MADNGENNVSHGKAAKKKSLLERIFNWICLTLLSLFIIALIIFRAPWTLVAVFIALLLVNTVVPKSFGKCIFIAFVIIVAAFVVWIFLPDDTEGWRPYTFDKELAAMEAKRSVPTEDNAAAIYNQLLENYDSNSFSKDFLSYKNKHLILSEFCQSKDYPEAASWLEENQQIIDQLMLASKKNKCRFPIAGDISSPGLKPPADFKEVTQFWWSLEGERVIPMRHWGELLIISANNDIAEGRIDEGLEKYIATLQIAKHLCQQPTPKDLLVGIAVSWIGLNQINNYVVTGNANDEYLRRLNNVVKSSEYDWRSDLHQILDRERLMFQSLMCAIFYQTNPEGQVRINRDTRSALRSQFRCIMVSGKSTWKPINPDSYGQIKLTKAMSVLCRFFVPSSPQKTAVIIDDIHKQYYSMADPEYDWQEKWGKYSLKSLRLNFRCLLEVMSRICESNWPVIHDIYLRAVIEQRGSQLLIALRRYKNKIGRWPQTLQELKPHAPVELFIDPVNNGSFVYRLTEESFVLYSKGRNNVDESCKHQALTYIRPCCSLPLSIEFVEDRADDMVIWPPKNR